MAYFRICPYCKSNLDPGEICECRKTTNETQKKQVFTFRELGKPIDRRTKKEA